MEILVDGRVLVDDNFNGYFFMQDIGNYLLYNYFDRVKSVEIQY